MPGSPPEATSTRVIPADYVVAIDHVGIAVPDLDTAVAWYTEHFGMVETHREINEDQGVQEAMLSCPNGEDEASAIQLLAPVDPTSTIAEFLQNSGPGLQQLAYRVTDIETVSDYLRGHGLRLLYPTPHVGTSHSRINFVHPKDAGGVLIELVEPDQDTWARARRSGNADSSR